MVNVLCHCRQKEWVAQRKEVEPVIICKPFNSRSPGLLYAFSIMATDSQERDTYTLESSTLVDENTWMTTDYTQGSDTTRGSTDAILNAIFGSLVTLATILGQIIVITVVSRDQRLRTPGNYFFISLAVADLLISIISMPTWTVYNTLGYWPLSHTLCNVWNTLDYVLCVVSIYTILLMSVDRYLSLRFPFTYKVKRTATRAKIALVLIWVGITIVYSLFVWLTQLFMAQDSDPEPCFMYYLTSIPLTFIVIILAFWTPVFGTSFFYFLVFSIVKKANKTSSMLKNAAGTDEPPEDGLSTSKIGSAKDVSIEMASMSTVSTLVASTASGNMSKDDGIKRRKSRESTKYGKELKAMKTIALLLITFAVCWLPLSVVHLFEPLKPGYLSQWWMIVTYWLGYVNSMLNPVCYAVGNPYFRETLYKLCRCSRNK